MLRNKITIQHKTTATDNIGQIITVWEDYATVHAYANRLSGEELIIASREGQQDTVTFTVRFSTAMSAINSSDYRVKYQGQIYNILTVDNVQYLNLEIKIRAVVSDES